MALVNQSPASSSDQPLTGAVSSAPAFGATGTGRSSQVSGSYLASRATDRDGRSCAESTAGRSLMFWRRGARLGALSDSLSERWSGPVSDLLPDLLPGPLSDL